MANIRLQNTQTNPGLRGSIFAGNSAMDNLRKSLAGLRAGFNNIDAQRDEAAKNAFQNRIAGLSPEELTNFNVNDAAKGSRLEAITLKDMLKQRADDEYAEQEQLFKRNQLQQQRNNAPLLQEYDGKVAQLRANGTTQEGINQFTEQFLTRTGQADNQSLNSAILNKSLDTGLTVKQNNRQDFLFDQNIQDRENRLKNEKQDRDFKLEDRALRLGQVGAEQAKEKEEEIFNSQVDQGVSAIVNKAMSNNEYPSEEAILNEIRQLPVFTNANSAKRENSILDFGRQTIKSRLTPTDQDIQSRAAKSKELNLQKTILDRQLKELPPQQKFGKPIANAEDRVNLEAQVADYIKIHNPDFGTTASPASLVGGGSSAGPEILKLNDNILSGKEVIKGTDPDSGKPVKLAPEDIRDVDIMQALASVHEKNNTIWENGVVDDKYKQAIFEAAIARKKEESAYINKKDSLQRAADAVNLGIKQDNSVLYPSN